MKKYYKLFFTEIEGERERGESTLVEIDEKENLQERIDSILQGWWGDNEDELERDGRWYYLCSGEIAIGKEYTKELTKEEYDILTKFSS